MPAMTETAPPSTAAGQSTSQPAADTAAADNGRFHHPYTPYDVQLQFMKAVYGVCAAGHGQVGLLESPTGTGKSLSLLCGALTWLRAYKRGQHAASLTTTADTDAGEPDWVVEQLLRRRRAELHRRWERREARLAAARRREQADLDQDRERGAKRRRTDGRPVKKRDDEEEAEFLIGDVGSDAVDENDPLAWLSPETRAMMAKAGLVSGRTDDNDDDDDDDEDDVKIYYTSRTHSQLTQFIAELRRPTFPSSIPIDDDDPPEKTTATDDSEPVREPIRHIPLSSRQRLCINPAVTRLGSVAAINDRCAELQKPKSKNKDKDTAKCPFALSQENRAAARQFRDTALATLPDIEDLGRLGHTLHVCPYYAARTAIPGAEIITLPYPLLLQKEARDALGICLTNSIVIVDEAHNLMDAVAGVHAAAIKRSDLARARRLLEVYVRRFGRRLAGTSRVMVGQLGRVIAALAAWLDAATSSTEGGIVDATALLRHKGADQINLSGLVDYVQSAKLAYKVESYSAYVEEQADLAPTATPTTSTPVLHTLVGFLRALTNLSSEGRIFFEKLPAAAAAADGQNSPPNMRLSYLLLSPTHAFASIAREARAVLLAGGTLAPFSDYRMHLFPQHRPDQITTLSCGHVVPRANLCVWTLAAMKPGTTADTSDTTLDFSFAHRSRRRTVLDLGAALLNLCAVVPDGVVVFFPSYGYLDEVVAVWTAKTADQNSCLWDRLQARKAVFRETRGGQSEQVLADYSEAILENKNKTQTGALLLSVVGGKMSEGINFADRLGRCVVVVGLPFPNPHAADWRARMEYVEATARANSAADTGITPQQAARDFYENACMRAVNQSIGRAIRHRNDYAAIVLVDRRFATPRIRSKLPAWICDGMVPDSEHRGLSGMVATVGAFFKGKKSTADCL